MESKLYQPEYDDPAIRGIEDERPWDVVSNSRSWSACGETLDKRNGSS